MEELRDPFIGEQQVKIGAMQTKLYPKKNYFLFHSVFTIFFN